MWWIALYLPQWPLEALGTPAPDAVEEGGRILCPGPQAAQAGVHPGMSVAAAQAHLPGLQLRARQPEQEARALRAIALAVMRFSPQVCCLPDGFLIEVQASLRLFGGPVRLWRQLVQVVETFKVSTYIGSAPYPEAAWLLARVRGPWRQQAARQRQAAGPELGVAQSRQAAALYPVLDALPLPAVLQAWDVPESKQRLLAGLGVPTLGALRALPRPGLQRRLGAVWLNRLDQTYGHAPDPRPFWEPPAEFDQRWELPERTTDQSAIEQALHPLLEALEGWLSAHGRLAQVLALHLQHEARRHEPLPDTVHTLRLAAPQRQAGVLQALWAERLGRHPLTAPVAALRLVLRASERPQTQDCQPSLPMAHHGQPGHEAPRDIQQALAHLLDRLQARLGPTAVQGVGCEDDHRPERAGRLFELAALDGPQLGPHFGLHFEPHPRAPAAPPSPSMPPPLPPQWMAWPQPLWLLTEPEPLGEHQGQPLHGGYPLRLCTPPERIEAGWFDGEPVCRDYHVAEGADHRLRWVFRQRRGEQLSWFLHGWFS